MRLVKTLVLFCLGTLESLAVFGKDKFEFVAVFGRPKFEFVAVLAGPPGVCSARLARSRIAVWARSL
jgi:hypothetical protein